jgi:hypothetical protein
MSDIRQTMAVVKLSNVVLETLADDGIDGIPESYPYMAMQSMLNLDQYQSLLNGMVKQKAIKISGHYITKGPNFDEYYERCKSLEQLWDKKLAELKATV